MDIADDVSTRIRIRLCIQTKYNPYVYCNKIITINKCDILMYILYLMLKVTISYTIQT